MKSHLTRVFDYGVWYVEDGNPRKTTLLMLHGLGASSERWNRAIPILSKHFHVIAPDMLGFGYSGKPETNYSIPFFVDFLREFVRKQVDHNSILLIGASLGGHVAAEFAIAEPEMLEKLVLVAPAGMLKEATPVLNSYIAAAMYPTFDNAKHAFEMMTFDPASVDNTYVKNFVNRMNLPHAKYAFLSALMGSKSAPRLYERLSQIKTETLILWGKHDKMNPAGQARDFKKGIPGSDLVIMKDSGHTPYVERPEEFGRIVTDFLGKKKGKNQRRRR